MGHDATATIAGVTVPIKGVPSYTRKTLKDVLLVPKDESIRYLPEEFKAVLRRLSTPEVRMYQNVRDRAYDFLVSFEIDGTEHTVAFTVTDEYSNNAKHIADFMEERIRVYLYNYYRGNS